MSVRHTCVRMVMFVSLLASAAVASVAIYAQRPSTQEAERVVTEFLTAFSNRDFARFVPFFSEDATMFFPPSAAAPTGRVRGRADIERAFRAIFERYPQHSTASVSSIRPLDLLVEEFGDVTVVTFHLGSETARQRRTLVLRRLGGDWKIVHLHGSASGTQP